MRLVYKSLENYLLYIMRFIIQYGSTKYVVGIGTNHMASQNLTLQKTL